MIAAIGDRESILPFSAFGIKSIEVGGISEARKVIALIKPGEYSVLFVTEEIMQALEQVGIQPGLNMVAIPGCRGSLGYGKTVIKELIRKATGAGDV